jgi:hypothetical protein
MSKVDMTRCDACGLLQGEDGRSLDSWAEVLLPIDEGLPRSMTRIIGHKKNYCLNCWAEIEKSIPRLPERPCAPPRNRKSL